MSLILISLIFAQILPTVQYKLDDPRRHVEHSISLTCGQSHKYTVVISIDRGKSYLSARYNDRIVIKQPPLSLVSRIGDNAIVAADPLECLGEDGEKRVILDIIDVQSQKDG